ncbi:MAG: RNA polymerase sigma factor [Actinomycetota bacterium]
MSEEPTGPIASPDAFRELFAATYSSIVAYAQRRVSPDQVDDVVSDVYTTAWRRRADVRPETRPDATALPWLYGIAANSVRNHRRADGRHLRLVEKIEAQPAAQVGAPPADGSAGYLRTALERLSFDDQEVLRLVAWEGLSHAEAGQVLGCSTNAVGVRIHRARKRLEVELERVTNPIGLSPNPPTETDHHRGER